MNYSIINPIKYELEDRVLNVLREKYDYSGEKKGLIVPAKKIEFGHYSFPAFVLAKTLKKSPVEIGKQLIEDFCEESWINTSFVLSQMGPYINFTANTEVILENLMVPDDFCEKYGAMSKTIVMDYSHPNIAKPFGIGHLRSTVIGAAIKRIYEFLGYKVIGVNHLGDWGTQFGKLIEAYKRWGVEEEFIKEPITHLYSLYVRFHKEAKENPKLDDISREWFKKLEDGDKEATDIWKKFRELSLKEFKKYYEILDIEFESYDGEAFYQDKTESAVNMVKEKGIALLNDGALVVEFDEDKEPMPPLLLRKSDGATTYATRDLAAVFYRLENYSPEKLLYVVGSPQKLHFKQLFKTLIKMGYDEKLFNHIDFGLIKFKDMKLSTREGNFIFLKDVIEKAVTMAEKIISEKNPELENRKQVAEYVGIGAIIFGDLANDRIKNIDFDWERVLSFEGETGPYIQYTYVRLRSIMRNTGAFLKECPQEYLFNEFEKNILWHISRFREIIQKCSETYKPSLLATYIMDLAKMYNNFYHKYPVNKEEDIIVRNSRLFLVNLGSGILKEGMGILGIKMPEKM